MEPMKVGRNERCPCGSGKKYKKCHGQPLDRQFTPVPRNLMEPIPIVAGETPSSLKQLIEYSIKYTFDGAAGIVFTHSRLGQSVRGELCAPVALLTQWLLQVYGVRSRVVFGSAKWSGYPVGFKWKGVAEYHAWVETEYSEIVDLACDALNERSTLPSHYQTIASPKNCWTRANELTDRIYSEVPYGGQEIDVDLPDSNEFLMTAQVALNYARSHEKDFSNSWISE